MLYFPNWPAVCLACCHWLVPYLLLLDSLWPTLGKGEELKEGMTHGLTVYGVLEAEEKGVTNTTKGQFTQASYFAFKFWLFFWEIQSSQQANIAAKKKMKCKLGLHLSFCPCVSLVL